MMFQPAKDLKLGGQEFIYNESAKTIVLEITEPFNSAGRILGWDGVGMKGLGVNKEIVSFVVKTKSKLLIRVLSDQSSSSYWMNYDLLVKTIKTMITEYNISGKTLHVIPWMLFTDRPVTPGAASD